MPVVNIVWDGEAGRAFVREKSGPLKPGVGRTLQVYLRRPLAADDREAATRWDDDAYATCVSEIDFVCPRDRAEVIDD